MRILRLQVKTGDGWQNRKERYLHEKEDISLITDRGNEMMEADMAHGKIGFCHRRFKANILLELTEDVPFETIQAGDLLVGTEARLIIQKTGKNCYSNCPIYKETGCSFLREILFLEVKKAGKVKLMDNLEYSKVNE